MTCPIEVKQEAPLRVILQDGAMDAENLGLVLGPLPLHGENLWST